jgi:hypothetical protein
MTLPQFNWFDPAELRRQFGSLPCKYDDCDGVGATFSGPARAPHFVRIECLLCGRIQDWPPAIRLPDEQITRRPSRRPRVPAGEQYCWICNLTPSTLQLLGRHLIGAHPIDRAAAIRASVDPKDDQTFPVCDYHHRWIDAERAQAGRVLDALTDAGVVELPVARPRLTEVPRETE